MMSISDNTATKLLQQYTSDETVTANIIEPLGMQDTLYRSGAGLCNYYNVTVEEYRKVTSSGGRFHARNGSYFRCVEPKNRQSSPRDMLKLLSLLQEGKFIDEETDRKILDIMLKCQTNSRIPAKLPHGVTVAHKTGTIDHLTNDCGIVYTDCGSYVLTLFYNGNLASEEEYEGTSWDAFGTALLAQLSRDIYDIYTESYQK
jgi:beta-lactamase class A